MLLSAPPIDLSVSPSKTKRGSPPKKKLRQQSILLSMRTKTRHDELAQAAEELGLPAPAPFKSASGAPIQLAPAIVEQQQREMQREAAAGAEAAGEFLGDLERFCPSPNLCHQSSAA